MEGILPVAMRSVHILSAIILLGGILFWRFAAESGGSFTKWRPLAIGAILGLLLSGTYNFVNKLNAGGLPKVYHSVIGVKFLLALHVFAVGLLIFKEPNGRRARQLTGLVISGVTIVVLSAVLRYVSAR